MLVKNMARLRNICFTCNNWTDDQFNSLKELNCDYIVMGKEVGKLGTPHLQSYIEFKNARTWKSLQKMLFNSRMAKRGSKDPRKAAGYCMKGESPDRCHMNPGNEYYFDNPGINADFFQKGQITAQGKRTDLEELAEMVIDGNDNRAIAACDPVAYMKFNKHINALRTAIIVPRNGSIMPKIRCFYGPTATGKTRMAYEIMNKADEPYYVWTPARERWFDGYCGEQNVIFDEFRGQIPLGILLTILDRYQCPLQYKGGTTEFCGMDIIITSPLHPKDWYDVSEFEDKNAQLMRRFHSILPFFDTQVSDTEVGG